MVVVIAEAHACCVVVVMVRRMGTSTIKAGGASGLHLVATGSLPKGTVRHNCLLIVCVRW